VANMISVQTYRACNLPAFAAEQMGELTNPGSAQRAWLDCLARGERHTDTPDDLVYAVATMDKDFEIEVIGWASVHHWVHAPALEAYIAPEYRRQRLASILSATVTLAAGTPLDSVCVFSPFCTVIADWLGFKEVANYTRVGDGWIRVSP